MQNKPHLSTRVYTNKEWNPTSPIENYDVLRYFIELNKIYPKISMIVSNDTNGYVSYDIIYKKLVDMGAELLMKSEIIGENPRKLYFKIHDCLILMETIISKSLDKFKELPKEYKNAHSINVVSQTTIMYPGVDIPEELLKAFNKSILALKPYPKVGIISRDNGGFFLNEIAIDIEYSDELSIHYGDAFPEFHEKLVKRLSEKNKGITLLHGVPGSGKTYYINKLIIDLKQKSKKKVILVPTNMVSYLLEPDFNTFLLDMMNVGGDDDFRYDILSNFDSDSVEKSEEEIKKGLIFILEDAEPVLAKREDSMSPQSTSNILNLTDGLLNSIFKIQIVATYNTSDDKIDPAVLRDKRLIAKREFKELSKENATRLAEHIGADVSLVTGSMSVAQIYSLLENEEDEILIDHKREKGKSKGNAGIKLD